VYIELAQLLHVGPFTILTQLYITVTKYITKSLVMLKYVFYV